MTWGPSVPLKLSRLAPGGFQDPRRRLGPLLDIQSKRQIRANLEARNMDGKESLLQEKGSEK